MIMLMVWILDFIVVFVEENTRTLVRTCFMFLLLLFTKRFTKHIFCFHCGRKIGIQFLVSVNENHKTENII